MVKISFKFEYGQKVLTPISNRAGTVEQLQGYTESGFKRYLVNIAFPLDGKNYFRSIREVFDECELRPFDLSNQK